MTGGKTVHDLDWFSCVIRQNGRRSAAQSYMYSTVAIYRALGYSRIGHGAIEIEDASLPA